MKNRSRLRHDQEALELGRQNVECIAGFTGWCKHARAEMVSSGLFAEMTSLPIGSHKVSCQYAVNVAESMNLAWIVPEFILSNCVGCSYHSPNGRTSWAESIIQNAKVQAVERASREQERFARLAELRRQLRAVPTQVLVNAPIEAKRILELVEGLFDDDAGHRGESQRQLVEAARIGPELFSTPIVDLLIDQVLTNDFGPSCLVICAELAGQRLDLSQKFGTIACEAIKRQIAAETAAKVLVALGNKLTFPLDSEVVEHLVVAQSYYRYIGGWEANREPASSQWR